MRSSDAHISQGPEGQWLLSGGGLSCGLHVAGDGLLSLIYLGPRVEDIADLPPLRPAPHRSLSIARGGRDDRHLNYRPQLYPGTGRGDFRLPALAVTYDGGTSTDLRVTDITVSETKPALAGLPSARGDKSASLTITMEDRVAGLRVDLVLTVYSGISALTRSATITSMGDTAIEITRAASSVLDLPPGDWRMLTLGGSWAREFTEHQNLVSPGRMTVSSNRGLSGAAHNPVLALMEDGAGEGHGHVIGSALLYSGNFEISVERSEFDDIRLWMGINPEGFAWSLAPGETFACPEVVHVVSDTGLAGMTAEFHRFVRRHIVPQHWAAKPRPTYINSWEACYWDVDLAKIGALATAGTELGVDMLVVDDGWFRGRTDDKRALGDWDADPVRFPGGLAALGDTVRAKGLALGIWVEPEAVSPDSDLARAHPDWILREVGRTPSLGRNQLLLDLSQLAVVDHLFNALDTILRDSGAVYLKWDCNRYMTEYGAPEVPHRYMLGLYTLLARLRAAHPELLLECCASGGARFDLGMLAYADQGWLSDMSDPIGRLDIQSGAFRFYPPSTAAGYIGPSPGHQTNRDTPMLTRLAVASLCAARGISLSLDELRREAETLKDAVQHWRGTATLPVTGTYARCLHTADETLWQLTADDRRTVLLVYCVRTALPNAPYRRVRLKGLLDGARYRSDRDGALYSATRLMTVGFDLPMRDAMTPKGGGDLMPYGDKVAAIIQLSANSAAGGPDTSSS